MIWYCIHQCCQRCVMSNVHASEEVKKNTQEKEEKKQESMNTMSTMSDNTVCTPLTSRVIGIPLISVDPRWASAASLVECLVFFILSCFCSCHINFRSCFFRFEKCYPCCSKSVNCVCFILFFFRSNGQVYLL